MKVVIECADSEEDMMACALQIVLESHEPISAVLGPASGREPSQAGPK